MRVTTMAVAGALGAAGLVGAAVTAPAVGAAAIDGEASYSSTLGRSAAVRGALSGLVSDGTLTQEQADKVATALRDTLSESSHHRVHRGFRLAGATQDVATALGVSTDELRTALREGRTLREVTQDRGLPVGELVDTLAASARKRLQEAVVAGALTRENADALAPALRERIRRMVERPLTRKGRSADRHDAG